MDLELVTATDDENPTIGDLKLTDGQVRLTQTFKQGVAQHLRIRLQFFFGEWFLDVREGVPYFQKIFVKAPDLGKIAGIFRRVILETPGIVALDNLLLDFNAATRILSVSSFNAKLSDNTTLTASDFGAFLIGSEV
jgi:hypothetical protein